MTDLSFQSSTHNREDKPTNEQTTSTASSKTDLQVVIKTNQHEMQEANQLDMIQNLVNAILRQTLSYERVHDKKIGENLQKESKDFKNITLGFSTTEWFHIWWGQVE